MGIGGLRLGFLAQKAELSAQEELQRHHSLKLELAPIVERISKESGNQIILKIADIDKKTNRATLSIMVGSYEVVFSHFSFSKEANGPVLPDKDSDTPNVRVTRFGKTYDVGVRSSDIMNYDPFSTFQNE
jgi:hypothetical protein